MMMKRLSRSGSGGRARLLWAAGLAFLLLAMALPMGGCGEKRSRLILAAEASLLETGLLERWIPMFEKNHPFSVEVVATGSGKALEMARDGDCDLVFTNVYWLEENLAKERFVLDRRAVMHDYLVIVGPPDDPAGIRGLVNPVEAFAKIAGKGVPFLSRGDFSGVDARERTFWLSFLEDDRPVGSWYMESGAGMADTLRLASQRQAYCLADIATYLLMASELRLEILVHDGDTLRDDYHVMTVNPDVYPDVNLDGARAFEDFLTGRSAQQLLEQFGLSECGEQLFYPDAL